MGKFRMARIHSIITVTIGGILYRDIAEITRWIDFRYCAENSVRYLAPDDVMGGRCVGRRSEAYAQLPYIEFFTTPITRIEFEYVEDFTELVQQMRLCGGWFAIDLDIYSHNGNYR